MSLGKGPLCLPVSSQTQAAVLSLQLSSVRDPSSVSRTQGCAAESLQSCCLESPSAQSQAILIHHWQSPCMDTTSGLWGTEIVYTQLQVGKLQQKLTSMSQPNPLKAVPSQPPILCLGLWITFNECVSSLGNPTPPFQHEYLIPTTHTNTNIHNPLHHGQQASTYFSRQGHHFGQLQGSYAKGISFPTAKMTILWFLVWEPKHGVSEIW